MRQVFAQADVKGRGVIGRRECGLVLKALGVELTVEETERLMGILDVNGDGSVSYRELLLFMVNQMSRTTDSGFPEVVDALAEQLDTATAGPLATLHRLRRLLEIVDVQRTGRVSTAAFGRCLGACGLALSHQLDLTLTHHLPPSP